MRTEQNIARLMPASDLFNTAAKTIEDLFANANQIGIVCVKDASGDLSPNDLFTQAGNPLAAGDEFKLAVKRADGKTEFSDTIKKDELTSLRLESYSAPKEQADYIGFNPETGAGDVDVIADQGYYASVAFFGATKHDFAMQHKIPMVFTSEVSGNTGYSIASGVTKVFRGNMKYYREGFKPIKVSVVADNAQVTALTIATGDITFTENSKAIKASVDIDAELVVGDLIKDGNALNASVFKIVSFDTVNNLAVLDHAYEGATKTVTSTDVNFIASASIASALFGIEIKGNTHDSVPGYFNFEPIRFNTGLFDFGTTPLSKNAVAASRGVGSFQYTKQLAGELAGNDGIQYRSMPTISQERPSYVAESDANAGGFNVLALQYNSATESPLGDKSYSKNQIYIPIDTDGATTVTNILAAFGGKV